MIIKTKKDFKGKCIELPKNLSEKIFNKIKNKFDKLALHFSSNYIFGDQEHCPYICYLYDEASNYLKTDNVPYGEEISIEDFLNEEENRCLVAYSYSTTSISGFGNIEMTQNSNELYINKETIDQWREIIKEKLKEKNLEVEKDNIIIINRMKMEII